ncbi:CopG family transcriptional regulator [Clostridium sp. DL1XJH146]
MSNYKKVKLKFPYSIKSVFYKKTEKSSKYIRQTLVLYIEKNKDVVKIEELKQGYLEMAKINLDFCEEGFAEEIGEFMKYEAELAESDKPDDYDGEKRRYILC